MVTHVYTVTTCVTLEPGKCFHHDDHISKCLSVDDTVRFKSLTYTVVNLPAYQSISAVMAEAFPHHQWVDIECSTVQVLRLLFWKPVNLVNQFTFFFFFKWVYNFTMIPECITCSNWEKPFRSSMQKVSLPTITPHSYGRADRWARCVEEWPLDLERQKISLCNSRQE